MKSYKIIFHIDMNCFFASVEIAKNPSLKNLPVVVARLDPLRKGIILSPNYEARKFGIKTTMKIRDALLLCPTLKVVEPDYDSYQEYSHKFFDYFYKITPLVEPASIDEGYLDVTEVCNNIPAIDLANKIQNDLLTMFNLPCSIGIAPNKFLAKMASDMKKPLGITILRKREIDKLLWPLPIEDMFGVGKKTSAKLREIGINTIGDLANFQNLDLLEKTVGPMNSQGLQSKANGNGDTHVEVPNEYDVSSISNSYTFDYNTKNEGLIKGTLKVLTNTVSHRLIDSSKSARTIGIQLKYDDFKLVNRSIGLTTPINDSREMYRHIEALYDEYNEELKDIRLVGVFANRLVDSTEKEIQYTLFDDLDAIEKNHSIENLIKDIQGKFGNDIIKKGKINK